VTKFIVEGYGEVLALPILVKRGKSTSTGIQCLDMNGKSNIVRSDNGFERTIGRQSALGFNRFFVLLDGDVFYAPYSNLEEERTGMLTRAKNLMDADAVRIEIGWAIRTYESWLIGGLKRGGNFCGLVKPIRGISGDTQSAPSDPKEWLKNHLKDQEYNPEVQRCLSKRIDLRLATRRNDSLKEFFRSI